MLDLALVVASAAVSLDGGLDDSAASDMVGTGGSLVASAVVGSEPSERRSSRSLGEHTATESLFSDQRRTRGGHANWRTKPSVQWRLTAECDEGGCHRTKS